MAASVAAAACVAMAVVVLVTALLMRPRDPLPGIALALEFLLAGGLLHLASARTWTALATAGLIVVVRKVAVYGLRLATIP